MFPFSVFLTWSGWHSKEVELTNMADVCYMAVMKTALRSEIQVIASHPTMCPWGKKPKLFEVWRVEAFQHSARGTSTSLDLGEELWFLYRGPHFLRNGAPSWFGSWCLMFFDSCVKIGIRLAILFWHDTCKQTWNYTRSAQLVRNTAPSTGHRAVACNIPARRFAEACRRRTFIATE